MSTYETSLAAEMRAYEHCEEVHSLPSIFHYWTNQHIQPALAPFGLTSPTDMFRKYLECANGKSKRFVSLGSGNCDLEIDLARQLRGGAQGDFHFDCVELNPAMLERGRIAAESASVADHFTFVQADLNSWNPAHEYDAVIANQSLHHIVNLEGVFDQIQRSLRPEGVFLISDVIGRNGHQRWPEALEVVHEFWRRLPPSYRFNRKSGCYEELYEDWDCSVEGFEGVRAQDILPLLVRQFRFRFFFPFGNAIDPFIDRAFGPNFDPARQWDRAFIDELHHRDEREFASGRLKPTHLLAVAVNEKDVVPVFRDFLSPEFCVRLPEKQTRGTRTEPGPAYQWGTWPHSDRQELENACARLVDSAKLIRKQTAWALSLEKESHARAEWARGLERELKAAQTWALRIDRELAERTASALRFREEIERELSDRTEWAFRLDRELEERTAWNLRLQAELEERTLQARHLEDELHRYLRNPLRLIARLLTALLRRARKQFRTGRQADKVLRSTIR